MGRKNTGVTAARQVVLDAINAGANTVDEVAERTGIGRSTAYGHMKTLARDGHIQVTEQGGRTFVDAGLRDYAAGWDAAARLAGNPDA
jgi:DNA-binding IclR family transcriptional regulator